MRTFGFYRELTGSPADPMLPVAVGGRGDRRLVRYLNSGVIVLHRLELVTHPLMPGASLGPAAIATDGEWLWPLPAAARVADGTLAVPPDLMDHASAASFQMQPVTSESTAAATRWLAHHHDTDIPASGSSGTALEALIAIEGFDD